MHRAYPRLDTLLGKECAMEQRAEDISLDCGGC